MGTRLQSSLGVAYTRRLLMGKRIPQSSPPPDFPHGFVLPDFRMDNLAGSARVAYGQKVAKFAGGCLDKKVA